ncbi:MAG: hypothetical protein P4L45_01540 [Ignavibacteriaceae bacterium]|nr:hypothetical protein [Ignavibacteriaceae bacterium]
MANNIRLECYTLRIRHLREGNYLLLNDINGGDLFNIFIDYFNKFNTKLIVDNDQTKTLQFSSIKLHKDIQGRVLSGIIECGEYGIESDIKDTITGAEKYHKQVTDTDSMPFYFLVKIPENHDKAILILQRTGIHGIHTIFRRHFEEYIKNIAEDITVEFNTLVSKDLANTFIEKGGIREIALRKYNMPADIASKLGLKNHKEDSIVAEIKFSAQGKNKFLPLRDRVQKFMSDGNTKFFDLQALNNLGFEGEYDTIIKTKLNGTTRTIDLSATGEIRPYYDIDREVEKGKDRHPIFESIDTISKKLMNDLYEEIYA